MRSRHTGDTEHSIWRGELALDSRNCLPTGNDGSEDVALHGDTEGEGNDIKEEEISSLGGGSLAGEDTGLDGGTVGDSLVGVDALLELLATEKVAEELLDLGNTGGATNENDLIDLVLGNVGVLEDLSNRVKGTGESLLVQVLETSTGDVGVEVLTIKERVDLDGGLGGVGERSLGTLASSSETAQRAGIATDVFFRFLRELFLEVVEKVGIEILAAQMCITSGGLDGEDTALDVQQRHIEGTATKIVDEDVPLLLRLSGTETVGDSGSGRLVDDTENVEASNGTSVLGSLTLVVVEVGGNGDDGLLDLLAELGLSDLLHLRWR